MVWMGPRCCASSVPRASPVPAAYIERALVTVLFTSTTYDGEKATTLAETAQRLGYRETLDAVLLNPSHVSAGAGSALVACATSGNVAMLEELLGMEPDETSLSNTLKAALSSLTDPVRIQVAKALLHHGVNHLTRSTHLLSAVQGRDMELVDSMLAGGGIDWNVAKNAVIHAAEHGYTPEMSAMINKAVPSSVAAAALEVLVSTGCLEASEYIQNAGHLLGVGLPAEMRSATLLRVFENEAQGLPQEFIALLIQHGAHPMVDGGRCFGIAAQRDDIVAAVQLVTAPRFDLDIAVRALINSVNVEVLLVQWLNVYLAYLEDVRLQDHSLLPLTIEKFPVSITFLVSLMDHGCEPGRSCGCNDEAGAATSLLMWALEVNGRASDAVLMQILGRHQHGRSAVHLAARGGRVEILRVIISHSNLYDIREMDGHDWTPLCHATAAGNTEAMNILFDAGAGVDDGSLHLASRNVDILCMQLLKTHGHAVQCPSKIRAMQGRFPLAELCYTAQGSNPSWHLTVEDAINQLQPLLDSTWRFMGDDKTVLHLAIDNPTSAFPILRAFLSISKLYANPNRDEDYLYTDPNSNLCYSPTEYVSRLCPTKPPQERAQLVNLLKDNQFRDRFFAVSGDQPEGAKGLPEALAQDIQKKKQDDWKTEQNLKRERAVAGQQKILSDETHQRQLGYIQQQQHQEFSHAERAQQSQRNHQMSLAAIQIGTQQTMANISLQTEQKRIDIARKAHQLESSHQASQNRREIGHVNALASQRLGAQRRQQAMEQEHQANIALLHFQASRPMVGYAETINETQMRRLEG
ncbi:hypothetical protein V8F06_005332 [Rhypophila decipiens]